MPYYRSMTGKNVIIKLGRDKKQIQIDNEPRFYPHENLQTIFPDQIEKVSTIDDLVRQEIIRQNPQSFQEHFLKNSVPTGAWTGRRCFIVAGGPSLTGFDFSRLTHEKVITINKSFIHTPFAEISFSIDRQFQDWMIYPDKGGPSMAEAQALWPNFRGHKVFLKIPGQIYQPGLEFVTSAGPEGISTSLEQGIYDGANSGYAAINLAIALGANPIYLLGYDMKHAEDGTTHFHGGYANPQLERQLEIFSRKFPKLARLAEEKNIQIFNLNPDSALDCFKFDTLENALTPIEKDLHDYVIVSFYTPEYEEDILRLTKSVQQFSLPHDFEKMEHLPLEGPEQYKNWSRNAYQKAAFIRKMMLKYPNKNIIWIDADAVVQQYPALFDSLPDCDIAVHYRAGVELLTGTLFIRNNGLMKRIVDEWIAVNQHSRNFLEQKNLENVLKNHPEVKVYDFPPSYCQIFDIMVSAISPVVEHFQSSRKWRKMSRSCRGSAISHAKNAQDVLKDGMWKGQRCFIIGGGPSLKGFDFNVLKGERVITLNKALEYTMFADIFFSIDSRFYRWLHAMDNPMLESTAEAFKKFEGIKCWLDTHGYPFGDDIYSLKLLGESGVSSSINDGIFSGKNSGYAALNLAICLGANPIYLLGYDMNLLKDQTHFHTGYGKNASFDPEAKHWIKIYTENAPKIKEMGIDVINLNPNSNLKCFEFGDIPAKAKQPFIVCSFYTLDYEESGGQLKKQLDTLGVENHVQKIDKESTNYKEWQNMTYYKATFIKEMLDKYPEKNIVWTDADSMVNTYPEIFHSLECDLAARMREGKLLTGTVFFKNNEKVRQVINEWINENEIPQDRFNCTQEQYNLQKVVEKSSINFKPLPMEYCTIFDERGRMQNCIIEHFQESRKFRSK